MKTIKYILSILSVVYYQNTFSQIDLSVYKHVERIHVTSYWGNINAVGTFSGNEKEFTLGVTHTNNSNITKRVDDVINYVSIEEKNKILYIETRLPSGFESINLDLKIPEDILLEIKLIRGGEIFVDNFNNGVEINSLNGSVKLDRIGEYAIVNATNGEIVANFKHLNKNKPVSLITMNGGVTIELPENCRRELRLISRKNGYIESDFKIESSQKIANLNKKKYSKEAIISTAKINGGGALLFLSTENGPIAIKKSKI
ncbi:hypothetical protein [uncultured Eudoraea sp.]|uniref:hypothetical protein n=1 Tax=uncultured Eudoraea sp. TaxID=1035614 RepID=UPI00260E7F72|nr:hypothetical protein [uncultured Eudoraea sp.]